MNRAQRRELRRFAKKIGVRVYDPSPEEYLTIDTDGLGWEIDSSKLEKDITDRRARGDMYRRVFECLNEALVVTGECPASWMQLQHECDWSDNGPTPLPFDRKRWHKVFLPSEIRLAEEWCIADGSAPEPTVNVEYALSPFFVTINRLAFRWCLSRFRFTPTSYTVRLLNMIRPGMGFVRIEHEVQEHERREHERTYRAKDGSIKTTKVRSTIVSAHTSH